MDAEARPARPDRRGAATGSIGRASDLLGALAAAPEGLALGDLARRASLAKTTAHRVLGALARERLVAQDPLDRTYRLGLRLADLGRDAARVAVAAEAARGMARLAEETGDTVFLSVPEGAASVCVARRVGSFPIRTLTLDRGDRRPLGVGAGALALHAALPEARRAAAARVNARWLAEWGFDAARLEALRRETRARGFALNRGGVVPGMSAVGLAVETGRGLAAALAVGAIDARMDDARIEALVLPALRREARALAERLGALEAA